MTMPYKIPQLRRHNHVYSHNLMKEYILENKNEIEIEITNVIYHESVEKSIESLNSYIVHIKYQKLGNRRARDETTN